MQTLRLVMAVVAAHGLAACTMPRTAVPGPHTVNERGEGAPTTQEILRRSRMIIEKEARESLGDAAASQGFAAPAAVLVRRAVSLPRMVQQPNGSWMPEPPRVFAAVRTPGGWLRHDQEGTITSFDPLAGKLLDRLLAEPATWSEPQLANSGCTDPSGIIVLLRHHGRERLSLFPCGLNGRNGKLAELVFAGRVADWSGVPSDMRPAGLPLSRFDEQVQSLFRYASGIREERQMAIRTALEWQGQWSRMMAPRGERPPPPLVDFGRHMLLLAAMGTQPTGGYRAVIDRVLETPFELQVIVRYVLPGPSCGATAALTNPVDVVQVPASSKQVTWLIERETADCR